MQRLHVCKEPPHIARAFVTDCLRVDFVALPVIVGPRWDTKPSRIVRSREEARCQMGRVASNLAHILLIRCHPLGNSLSLTRGAPEFQLSAEGAFKSTLDLNDFNYSHSGKNLFLIHFLFPRLN